MLAVILGPWTQSPHGQARRQMCCPACMHVRTLKQCSRRVSTAQGAAAAAEEQHSACTLLLAVAPAGRQQTMQALVEQWTCLVVTCLRIGSVRPQCSSSLVVLMAYCMHSMRQEAAAGRVSSSLSGRVAVLQCRSRCSPLPRCQYRCRRQPAYTTCRRCIRAGVPGFSSVHAEGNVVLVGHML